MPETIQKDGLQITKLYTPTQRIASISSLDTSSQTFPYSSNGHVRTISYTYSFHDSSDVIQYIDIDGPRNDVNDVVRNEYDVQGNLIRVINPLSHEMTYSDHNSRGFAWTDHQCKWCCDLA